MNCLFLIPSLQAGGAERVMTTLANGLSKRGHNIVILKFDEAKSFYTLNKRVVVLNMGIKLTQNRVLRPLLVPIVELRRLQYLKKTVRAEKPDLVLSFCMTANIFNILQGFGRQNCIRIISERNDPSQTAPWLQWICKKLYPKADAQIFQSEVMREYYTRGARKTQTRIIENPLNGDSLPETVATNRKKTCVAVGRLIPQKNFAMLIEAFYKICKHYPEYILEIYGAGPLQGDLTERISKLELQQRVFLKGVQPNVMQHIYDSTVFVLCSNFEGFPNVLVEAMASGIPVISTDFRSGVARRFIEDKKNGFLVPVGDVDALASALSKILGKPELIQDMAMNNFKIRDLLSEESILDKWESCLQEFAVKQK